MDKSTKKKSPWGVFWPKITTMEIAKNTAMQAFWAAIISAVITALFAIASIYGMTVVEGIDVFAFIDVMFLLVLAWGIRNMSRTAATIMLVYFVISKIYIISLNGAGSVITIIIFGLLYANGVRGTFAYQKFKQGKTAAVAANAS